MHKEYEVNIGFHRTQIMHSILGVSGGDLLLKLSLSLHNGI